MSIFTILFLIFIFTFVGYVIFRITKFYNKYDSFEINENQRQIIINNEAIKFKDIVNITIDENIEDISIEDRFINKDTGRLCIDRINFELKDGSIKYVNTRYRNQLYKILKTLKKYKNFNINLEEYKPNFFNTYELIIFIVIVIFLLKKFI